jgi:hypothetical protein
MTIIMKQRSLCRILFGVLIATSLALTSCNVTRTVTTTSEYVQKGDTTVVIQSKTIESYDGTKK